MDQKLIKILAINSSPKSDGHTARFLEHFEKAAKQLNAEVTHMDLYHEKIPFFSGILGKKLKRMSHVQKAMVETDGFIIATPTYWFNEPGVLKNFIDNLTPLEENGFKLEGKVGGFIVYSPEGGEIGVLENLAMTFNHMGVILPPYSFIFYRGPQDDWVMQDIKDLAKRMIVQISAQKQLDLKWDKWKD